MTRRFAPMALVFVATVLASTQAFGQSAGDLSRAAELKKQGDALVHSLHYREALTAYDEAFALGHDPAISYNRGRALDALGDTPQALDAFEEFLRVAPASLKAKVPKLDELVASVRARVATLVIHCPVPGANVLVRRRLEGITPLTAPLRVRTGQALVEVQAAGYQAFRAELDLGSGAPTTFDVALVKEVADAPPVASAPVVVAAAVPPPEPVVTDKAGAAGWKWGAYSAGAVGIAGIATGAIFGALALDKQSAADANCPAHTCNLQGSQMIADARAFATVSTIGFVVGGVGLATSILLFVWKPGRSPAEARLFPVIGPAFGGLAGSF